ncbi:alpha/beta fold hydrolase [Bordetella bronchiseptica]|uniref:alpha/beta fold hydrolase n=1 Tax=Bordetella bronchiseptica TaxID=518 RepID=UPI0004611F77|nr:alpha/beta hydrolase [Bordetella bronchiseptica]KDD15794.1 alpha/beta hydrolase family protein [Bordetella bronchiseptica MBORD707]
MQDNKELNAAVDAWLDEAVADAVLARAATGLSATLALAAPSGRWRLAAGPHGWAVQPGAPADAADVAIEADDQAWLQLLKADPVEPGWQSFGAIIRQNERFSVTGEPLRLAHLLPCLERLIELAHRGKRRAEAPAAARDMALIQGRYTVHGAGHSPVSPVYWEESGAGAPIVMLHTAGADSRQFRHQLSDVEVARDWKMYAFDMPGHGRSGMPAGWSDGEAYLLTQQAYLDACVRFLEQVVKAPAIIMGCSMGAAMSLVLGARRPDLVAGVIALEAPWRAPGRRSPLLADARVNAGLHNPSYVRALLSPTSPQAYRDEACWIYSQAGFGIYSGDLGFYSNEFDGELVGRELARTDVPVYLLTGSYDYSASPDNTRKLAALVPQAEFHEMADLGHFPMSENPDGFRPYWLGALARLREQMR